MKSGHCCKLAYFQMRIRLEEFHRIMYPVQVDILAEIPARAHTDSLGDIKFIGVQAPCNVPYGKVTVQERLSFGK